MRRLTWMLTLLLALGVTESVKADETITVSSTSSEIAAGLDLKAVAKIFASAKDLEQFEAILNNPDSSFVNLDLNGDGDIDYIRVVETGSGDNHLIVLQAILAKDIFQDVASIRVVKDEAQNIQVTITGDEKIYGTNYVITPVYIYRPVIYDWFWGPHWYCWNSPYYWGYWPGWWHPVPCWGHDWYAHHIHVYHHAHPYCSFRTTHEVRTAARVASPVASSRVGSATTSSRAHYAEQSSYMPNRTASTRTTIANSTRTPATRSSSTNATRSTATATRAAGTETRSAGTTLSRSTSTTATATRSAGTETRSAGLTTRHAGATAATRTGTTTRSTQASTQTRTYTTPQRNTNVTRSSSYTSTPSSSYSGSYNSTRSAGSYSGGGYSGGSVRSSGGFSGGAVRSSGGSMRR